MPRQQPAGERRRWLAGVGEHAVIAPDGWVPGAWVLSIGGAEQSHVNLEQPREIFYENLRRIANHLDLLGTPGEPLRVLHLGAGAMTLARYVEATRPGSTQVAVDSERELLGFVTDALPLPPGMDLRMIVADARSVLAADLASEAFDAIVLDIFKGPDAPAHLVTADYQRELAGHLRPGGVVLVNVGDDPPLAFARAQLAVMEEAFGFVSVAAPAEMFSRRFPGNLILMGTSDPWPPERLAVLRGAGPHPGDVLSGIGLDGFRKP
jgi:spermidine synthase